MYGGENEFDENTPEYEYYTDLFLEESASDRSSCRTCHKKIAKGILRWCSVQVVDTEFGYTSNKFYHTSCLPGIAGHPIVDYSVKKKTGSLAPMGTKPTKQIEKDLFNSVVKKYVDYRNDYERSLKFDTESESEEEEEEEVKVKPKKEAVKKEKKQTETAAKTDSKKRKRTEVSEDEDCELGAYDDSQRKKYQASLVELKSKNIAQLKAILKANNQTQSGNKEQLIEKVADGITLGAIPQCTKCGGGKLRFNKKTGVYSCPGYMEDTDKVDCDGEFKFDQVVRFDWVDS